MKPAPRSHQHHDLYPKNHGHDNEISGLLGECGRKSIYVMALAFGFGLGVSLVPDALSGMPDIVQKSLGSPITIAGLVAILATLILPDDEPVTASDDGPGV